MDRHTLEQLQTPLGAAALAAATALAPTPVGFLQAFGRLNKRFPAELARAALETVLLRQKARGKFTRADLMFFTRTGLEQASGEIISRHRAQRFAAFQTVGDFCCGIGGDTLSLAQHTAVIAVDLDPIRLALARHNVAVNDCAARVSCLEGDLLHMPLPEVAAAFVDPDRRADGARHVALRHYRPALAELRRRLPADLPLGVKLAPAIAWAELAPHPGEVEFLSVAGELKECVMWTGSLRTCARRATVLPGGESLAAESVDVAPPPGPPGSFLLDPDPAITRAGLVTNLAVQLGARQIDPEIAFLTADTPHPTAFGRWYRVDEALPFHVLNLRERLRARGVGRITPIRRGSPIDPVKLTKQLKLSGPAHQFVILTRVLDRPYVLIASAV